MGGYSEIEFMKRIMFLLVFFLALAGYAQDIRCKVQTDTSTEQLTKLIDPDSGIYGIAYGTTEDEFISKFGNPNGYLRLSPGTTAMIYGKSHAFLFSGNKLTGVRITDLIFDWKLGLDTAGHGPFDTIRWRINNGITKGMNLAEVKRILGENPPGDKYSTYYETTSSRVELEFAHYTDGGDTDKAYEVNGLLVKKR